jgi:hypothetical protein
VAGFASPDFASPDFASPDFASPDFASPRFVSAASADVAPSTRPSAIAVPRLLTDTTRVLSTRPRPRPVDHLALASASLNSTLPLWLSPLPSNQKVVVARVRPRDSIVIM